MMEDIKIYTYDEIAELIKWFDNIELPDSLQVDKATYIPDLKETLKKLIAQIEVCYTNPKLQGAVILLERIKAKLQ